MSAVPTVVGWALLVAASLAVGAFVAGGVTLPARLAAEVTTFGGGILLSAVAFELVPEAHAQAGLAWTSGGLVAGSVLYVVLDAWLARDERTKAMRRSGHAAAAGRPMMMTPAPAAVGAADKDGAADQDGAADKDGAAEEVSRGESIAAGIVADGVPESVALGLMAASGGGGLALLVAVVVGNVTEAYGAAQPIITGGRTRRFALGLLCSIGVGLGVATILGGTFVADAPAMLVGAAQALAAGAVLAVLSISIFPYAFAQANRRVALAASLGFTLGYLLSA